MYGRLSLRLSFHQTTNLHFYGDFIERILSTYDFICKDVTHLSVILYPDQKYDPLSGWLGGHTFLNNRPKFTDTFNEVKAISKTLKERESLYMLINKRRIILYPPQKRMVGYLRCGYLRAISCVV